MNIYITPANEAWLRKQVGSMSGIINELLANMRMDEETEHSDLYGPVQGSPIGLKLPPVKQPSAVGTIDRLPTSNASLNQLPAAEMSPTSLETIESAKKEAVRKDRDTAKLYNFCPHGSVKGMCKKGCK